MNLYHTPFWSRALLVWKKPCTFIATGLAFPLPPLPTALRLLIEDFAHPIPTGAVERHLACQKFSAECGHPSGAYLVFLNQESLIIPLLQYETENSDPFPRTLTHFCLFKIMLSKEPVSFHYPSTLSSGRKRKGKEEKCVLPLTNTQNLVHSCKIICTNRLHSFTRAAVTKCHSGVLLCNSLEARNAKARCPQGWFLLRVERENLFQIPLLACR